MHRKSVLFEMNRLFAGLLRVDVSINSSTQCDGRLALLRFVGNQVQRSDWGHPRLTASGEHHNIGCPAFSITCDDGNRTTEVVTGALAHFDIGSARQRLALLARLGDVFRSATGNGNGREFYLVPLYWQVSNVMRGFSLQLTECGLSGRLNIDPSTLRRWFHRVGAIGPERFMQWVRLYEIARHVAKHGESVERTALRFGFANAASIRRTLRVVARTPVAALRTKVGSERLLERMTNELYGTLPIRAPLRV